MIPISKDYAEYAISKLLWQYRDSVNLQGILKSFADQLGLTQDDTFDIVENFNIGNATGEVLDFVGKIVGESRGGRSDDEFRDAITLRIVFNTSQGTPNKILQGLSLATNATKVKLWEHYPVSCIYYTNGDQSPDNLQSAIQNSSPACSGNVFIMSDPNEDTFIPSEIDYSLDLLVTHDDDEIVTENDDEIETRNLIPLTTDATRSMLSEYTYGEGSGSEKDTPDGKGILCELI